jgi:hypothetical protein
MLKVSGLFSRKLWLNMPSNDTQNEYPIARPKNVKNIILEAYHLGWDPNKKGSPFLLELDNTFIQKYEAS